MDRIECMKLQLMSAIETAMQDLSTTDTKELGEAIDMLKDLEEAAYYCTITKAMNKNKEEDEQIRYYTETDMERPQDRKANYMGRSGDSRRAYMESKEKHHDKTIKMQELEAYMKDLTKDLVEMIDESSPEEKQLLQQKLNILSNKIAQTNV